MEVAEAPPPLEVHVRAVQDELQNLFMRKGIYMWQNSVKWSEDS